MKIKTSFFDSLFFLVCFLSFPVINGAEEPKTPLPHPQSGKPLPPPAFSMPGGSHVAPGSKVSPAPSTGTTMKPPSYSSLKTSSAAPAAAHPPAPFPKAPTAINPLDEKIQHGVELVSIDFPNGVALSDILKTLGLWTGKNYMLAQGVSGSTKISIVSAQPVTKEEAYQAFLSALNISGLTTVETGKIVKIMPVNTAKSSNIKTYYGDSWAPATDELINQVVPLHYIDANSVISQLRTILGSTQVSPFTTTNSLIITDTGHRIRKILEIVKILDDKSNQAQVSIVPINYMDAKDAAAKVQDIFGNRSGTSLTLQKAIVDERTNSLILVGSSRGLDDIVRFLQRIDKPVEDRASQATIRVRPLDYADAEKLATTLQALANNSSANKSRPAFASAIPSAAMQQMQSGGSVVDFSGVKITADKATNSLIVQGSKAAYDEINQIINILDRRRMQVYLESDMLDIRIQNQLSWKPSLLAGHKTDDGRYALPFAFNPGTIAPLAVSADTTSTSSSSGLAAAQNMFGLPDGMIGILGNQSISVAGFSLSPGAFILALKSDTNNNVLQTPSILVSDNETANLSSGEEYSTNVVTSTTAGVSSVTPVKTLVTTSLKVTPQISRSDFVSMKITLNLDDAAPPKANETAPSSVTKRAADTTVVAQSGQTVVIGGLVTNSTKDGEGKVPLLGDIPILGWLFKTVTHERRKNNLVLFLTPYVIRNSEDLSKIYEKKIKERDEFLKVYFGKDYKKEDFYSQLRTPEDGKVPPARVPDPLPENKNQDQQKTKVLPSEEKAKINVGSPMDSRAIQQTPPSAAPFSTGAQ